MERNGDGSDSTPETDGDAVADEDVVPEDDPEMTRFERAFIDHPLARDLVLFGFLAGFYGGSMWLLVGLPVTWVVGMGVAFAVGWLALMELFCWGRDTSMLRSIGEDPLK